MQVPIDACKASLYAVGDPKEAVSYSICAHGGGAPIAAFNSDGSCLRIGTQLYYAVGGIGEYRIFDGMDGEDFGYIEEIAGLNGFIAVASRRSDVARAADERDWASREGDDGDSDCARTDEESVVSDSRADQGYERDDGDGDSDSDGDYARSDAESVLSDSRADQEYERDDGDSDRDYRQSDDGFSESSEYSDQGYETYSSCSSADDPEGLADKSDSEYTRSSVRSEDEDGLGDEDGDEDGAVDASEDAREDDHGSDGYANSDSDDGVDPSVFACSQMRVYGDQGVARRRRRGAKPPLSSEGQRAIVQVFGRGGRLFRCRTRITDPLSDSPPVFHPHKPLLVWPLGGRTVLFADYEDNTYFEREVGRSSTTGKWSPVHSGYRPLNAYLLMTLI